MPIEEATTTRARTGFRFRPPEVCVAPETDWLLARAFGPTGGFSLADTRQLDCETLLSRGELYDILSRIRSRVPRDLLAREIGTFATAQLNEVCHKTAAVALLHKRSVLDLARIAADHRIPLIFLKGMAVDLCGLTSPGARPANDVDVLVPADTAQRLYSALLVQGYEPSGFGPEPHHLPGLRHPMGGGLEVHHRLIGIRVADENGVSAAECLSMGLCKKVSSLVGDCFVPTETLLLAHFLVHGLAQHGMSPQAYCSLRLLADLQDLEFSGPRGEAFFKRAFGWIERAVSRQKVEASRELLRRFEAGERASRIVDADDDAGFLLRHMLAGYDDVDYQRALTLLRLLEEFDSSKRGRAVLRNAGRALWLRRAQIDVIYGRPKTSLGYLGWRLWRPFDLVRRLVRAGLSAFRLKLR